MSKVIKKTSKDGSEYQVEVIEDYGAFGDGSWQYHLCRESWNGGEAKFGIRKWNSDMSKFSSGLSFTDSDLFDLLGLIEDALDGEEQGV